LLGQEGLEVVRVALRQRGADRNQPRPFEERHRHDAVGGRADDEREIHVTSLERAMVLGEVELLELEDEPRVVAADRLEEPIPDSLRVFVGEEADPDLTGEAAGADLRHAPEVGCVVEQLRRHREELGSRTRQGNGFARALEQLDTELTLERLDLLADRRLGDVQLVRGAPEVQLASDLDEVFELPELHAFASSPSRRCARWCDRQGGSRSAPARVPIVGVYRRIGNRYWPRGGRGP
jgi:hypothetical protein